MFTILLLVLEQIVASKTWLSNTDRLHTTGRYNSAVIMLKASMYLKDFLGIGSMSLIALCVLHIYHLIMGHFYFVIKHK
ncbi:hypothetical protein DPMN_077466 [Dreissena polymorpha]|uniref:Uncharacterized protein n=1 Tax=Dreissena polymorpha TaxID=45954 RepID=A0A9D3YKI7_DREPO|nr:hypothetical protein DPMN_077466 [Dreissena polymorpha]